MRCFLVTVREGVESGVPGIVWTVGFQEILRWIGWSGGVRGEGAVRSSVGERMEFRGWLGVVVFMHRYSVGRARGPGRLVIWACHW